MRLLFLNRQLGYASATSYTMDLALSLKEQGDEVRLCTIGGDLSDDFVQRGIETYRARFNLFAFRKLIEFLRDYNPELVHVQSLASLTFARRILGRLEKPYIVTVHRRPGPKAPRLGDKLLCGVIVLNEVIRESLVNDQNLPKSLIRVIRRGIRLPKRLESPAAEQVERIPVVGSVGRLSREKGHHCFIRAAAKVLETGLEAHFAIVGDGPEESRLRALVKKLDLEYHVTFSPHLADRRQLYRLFDIVALPVLSSGVGVSALEAMAMGKPLIASAVGEMLHIVQDRQNGLLVPEDNADVLAQRIVELIRDPGLMATLGKQGRAWVEKNFELSSMVSATRSYYPEALSRLKEGIRL